MSEMRAVLEILKILACTCSLGSIRAGGTTRRYLIEANLPLLRFQGMCNVESTMFHYVQQYLSTLGEAKLAPSSRAGVQSASIFFLALPGPPKAPLRR